MSNPKNCPSCKTSLVGDPIPADIAHHYVGTHWKREIGIDGGYMGIYDGTVAYRCPDCDHEFPVSEHPVHIQMFQKYKKLEGD
jgi:hypothetical protein